MADIRERIRSSAPAVRELDLAAIHARAEEVAASEQRRRRRVFAGATVTLCLVLIGVVVTVVGRPPVGQVAVAPVTADADVGVGVDAIGGPALSGGELGIADFQGQPLIVFGWAEWCGPCMDVDLPMLAGVVDNLGVEVVGVAVSSNPARAREALDTADLELPTILLAQEELAAVLPSDVGGGVPLWVGLNAEHEIVDTVAGSLGGVLRLQTMADRARTRTEPDPHVTVLETPQLPQQAPTGPPPSNAPASPPSPSMASGCSPGDRTYVVQPDDTLSTIAETVYGDLTLFGPIAEANGLTGQAPLFVGQVLDIPDCGTPHEAGATPLAALPAVDADVRQAIEDAAPEGWRPRPTHVADGIAYGDADGGILIRQLLLEGDVTPEAAIEDAIAGGAGRIDLPDGTPAAFTNPAATGHMLVPLPGGRLIQLAGEGNLADTLDYEISILQEWMGAVREHLG